MTDVVALKQANARRWADARLLKAESFVAVARRLADPNAQLRYRAVSATTGVPWFVVAVIHERESSQDWTASLAQGDPWSAISSHIPAGRGPFKSWEEAATDALVNCGPHARSNQDWSIGGVLTMLEGYNGLGYAMRGAPSPYIWAGTNQYQCGKFVRDGVFDPKAVDQQLGCAGLLRAMMGLDQSVTFAAVTAASTNPASKTPRYHPPDPPQSLPPSVTSPAAGSIGAFIASILSAILKLKGK
jgi:lysozyme family protein